MDVSQIPPNIIFENLPKVPGWATSHGTMMGLTFVILYPSGAFIIRFLNTKHRVWIHAGVQVVGLALMLAGLSFGIRMGKTLDRLHNNAHTILGTVVVAAAILQPILGFLHHRLYKSKQKRTVWTHIHIWLGRVIVILGIINGGLGLLLASGSPAYSKAGTIAYSVVAALSGAAFVAVAVMTTFTKGRTASEV